MKRTVTLLAFLFTAAVAPAAIVVDHQVIRPVPAIPHGLDWSVPIAPDPKIEQKILSADELKQILPRVIELGRIEGALTLGPALSRDKSPIHPLIAISTGIVLILGAYRLIPRAHSHVLRLRSMNLDRDLFT